MNSILPSSMGVGSSMAAVAPRTDGAAAGASGTSEKSGTPSSNGSTELSTSGFMSLLVAEMKNQDPTSPTDPTQFVQQLVGVNSLEQLIQINQGVNGVAASTNPTNGTTTQV